MTATVFILEKEEGGGGIEATGRSTVSLIGTGISANLTKDINRSGVYLNPYDVNLNAFVLPSMRSTTELQFIRLER